MAPSVVTEALCLSCQAYVNGKEMPVPVHASAGYRDTEMGRIRLGLFRERDQLKLPVAGRLLNIHYAYS